MSMLNLLRDNSLGNVNQLLVGQALSAPAGSTKATQKTSGVSSMCALQYVICMSCRLAVAIHCRLALTHVLAWDSVS